MKVMKTFLTSSLLLLIVLMLFLGGAVGAAQAQAPTPTLTPTLAPIQPTETSPYGGLRPTPTALTLNPDPTLSAIIDQFDMRQAAGSFADQTINLYRALNASGVADLVMFISMGIITIIFLVRTLNKLNKTHD